MNSFWLLCFTNYLKKRKTKHVLNKLGHGHESAQMNVLFNRKTKMYNNIEEIGKVLT